MRKLGLFALVLGLVVCFAMPATALIYDGGKGQKMYIGGVFLTDIGAWNRSKERTGISSDRTELMLNVPANSQFRGYVESGAAGGYWEFGLGTAIGDQLGTGNYVEIRKLYGYYKFGNCELRTGKDDSWMWSGALDPAQSLGVNFNTVRGFGWGVNYDQRAAQVAFLQTISKQFNYRISLVSPRTTTEAGIGVGATSRTSYAQIPTLAAKFDLNFGMFRMIPAFGFTQVKWDNVASGNDDSITAWNLIVPFKVTAGPFALAAGLGYGQNIANIINNTNSTYQTYARVGGQVKNTTALNGYIDVAFTAGPMTPHLFFGYDKAENTDAYVGDKYNVRMMYGAALHYVVTPNFIVKPELTFYDYGKKATVAGNPDIGKDWMGGIQFAFVF